MNSGDFKIEFTTLDSGTLSNTSLLECLRRSLMLPMLLVYLLKKTLPMVSQLLDLLRETPIGLFTISTLRDGSSAGL